MKGYDVTFCRSDSSAQKCRISVSISKFERLFEDSGDPSRKRRRQYDVKRNFLNVILPFSFGLSCSAWVSYLVRCVRHQAAVNLRVLHVWTALLVAAYCLGAARKQTDERRLTGSGLQGNNFF